MCADRFEEEGSPKRRRLEAGPGYSSKNAGFPLRQAPLPGAPTDQQGLPLDPQQVLPAALARCKVQSGCVCSQLDPALAFQQQQGFLLRI